MMLQFNYQVFSSIVCLCNAGSTKCISFNDIRSCFQVTLQKKWYKIWFTLAPPESIMEICSVNLTFESMDEILWCDHSNETSLAVCLHGTINFVYKFFLNFDFGHPWESKS